MTQGQQPEAIRLADEYEHVGFVEKHRFAKEEWCRKAALELRRLHAENASLSTGYDAARLEIKSLQAELVKESARTAAEKLRADQMTAQHKMQCNLRRELEEMLAAVGAGGVEPLRKADHFRDATKMVPSDHLRDATEMIEKQPSKLSDSEIDTIAEAMPGGLDGFLKGWGWRQFARAVIGAAGGEDALDAAPQQPVPAVQGDALTREQIRDVFLANGFTIKEGLTDLMPYVYDAAYALLARRKETEMQTIWYRVIDHCEASYYGIELPDTYDLARPMEQTLIAARCADDYHSNHDGWESNWPLTFALHGTEEGPEVARLNIDREAVPHFYASHVKTPSAEVSGANTASAGLPG